MTTTAVLVFDIRSWWHVGTGMGLSAQIDASVSRDALGLPVLHGKAVQGLVREALQQAAEFGRIPPDAPLWFCGSPPPRPGKGPDDDGSFRRQRFNTRIGHAVFDNATPPDAWRAVAAAGGGADRVAGLFQALHATAIDDQGQAKDKTLRAVEVTAPLTLRARVAVAEPPPWLDEPAWAGMDWPAVLARALPLIRGLGGHRSRGLGRVRVTLEVPDAVAETPATRPAAAADGTVWMRLDLLGDTILSAHSGTAGQHVCLDHIPGAVILGALARHYEEFQKEGTAWDVFHSGRVSFGCAYPLMADGRAALPVPLSWHGEKLGARGAVHDLSAGEPNGQPKQMREGFIGLASGTEAGAERAKPTRRFRRMTAMDRERDGYARSGALFGFEYLTAGQSFWFVLTMAGVPEAVRAKVVERLTAADIRIGKSRTAEFGRARIRPIDRPPGLPLSGAVDPGGPVVVYLLSDTALIDEATGTPVTEPRPVDFGLPAKDWSLDRKRSFLRVRGYAPVNGHRRAFDLERQVIVAGSVLVFKRCKDGPSADPAEVERRAREGVGLHRQDGLGRILVNPPFVGVRAAWTVTEGAAERLAVAGDDAALDGTAEGRWLDRRFAERTLPPLANEHAQDYERYFQALYAHAEKEARLRPDALGGPSRAQWGTIRQSVAHARTLEELRSILFDRDHGVCSSGVAAARWSLDCPFDVRGGGFGRTSFADLLGDLIEPKTLHRWLADARLADPAGADPAGQPLVFELGRMVLTALAQRMPRLLAQGRVPADRPKGKEAADVR
ncbi:hypothetical protein HL658_13440 [Azospirillum sp. RWY-5-1]|uniref:CRISPR-associated protein Csx10 n=1 Tax=Azospirillum oleiclasticum TaxID=2735135 RepID=A0ABX2T930_9PROT|nr:hypothetical protein [Azospirillum oleiclasticum]NYZ13556.1 hypothetical protein [Azospirillum oleiclasticum]NYZ20716.1 hypothetical protein [Azospirillum oleiclasticum]